MSWQASKYVWENSKQTGGMKLTLLAIADFASPQNGWTCEAAIETIAEMVGVSDRQIKKNLKALEDAGELNVSRNIGRGNTNIYSLLPLVKGEPQDIKGEPQDTLNEQEKVNSSTEKVNSRVVKGEPQDTQTNITKKQYIYAHPQPEKISELITAISQTVKTAYGPGINEDEFESAAYAVLGWDATPDRVTGFGDWWKANGYYKGKPALKSFLDEFCNYLDGIKNGTPQNALNGALNGLRGV